MPLHFTLNAMADRRERGRADREMQHAMIATPADTARADGAGFRPDVARLRPLVMPTIGVILFAGAVWALHREIANWHPADIRAALATMPRPLILLAIAVTAVNYLFLAAYDILALRYLERPLPLRRTLLAGFVGYAFSHTIGMPVLTGTAVRYRLYSAWGLGAADTAGIIAYNGVTFWLGVAVMVTLGTLAAPQALEQLLGMNAAGGIVVGGLVMLLLVGYAMLGVLPQRRLAIGGWQVSLPSVPLAVAQILLSTVDWLLAALVLYLLLPDGIGIGFLGFAALFTAAQVAGVASNVPGGLGVFEAVLLIALPDSEQTPALAASLIIYRIVYYILPLLAAALLFAANQVRETETLRSAAGVVQGWAHLVVPNILGVLVMVGGVVLLISGATPSVAERMAVLAPLAPLVAIELSHFFASLAGLALLLLGFALRRRLDAAWVGTVVVLAAGAVLTLVKGGDWEEALFLLVILALVAPSRAAFYRRSSLTAQRPTPGVMVAVLIILIGATWLGFFSYSHVEYRSQLWWQFVLEGDAPRFLRTTAGLFVAAGLLGGAFLLRYARPHALPLGTEADIERARAVITRAEAPGSNASLAFLGDKRFLFSESGASFIMYGIQGRTWVAMGEPVGRRAERLELLWQFRELADSWGGNIAFYEVGSDSMPELVELGLAFYKLGEQAHVPLAAFSLEGSARSGLRQTKRRLERAGASFAVLPPEEVPALMPTLQAISDGWIEAKRAREKAFSLGRFDPGYLARFPLAVIRHEGEIVAFANLWTTPDRREFSIDLMRYGPDAPREAMEYLFVELLLWGKAQGFARFDLGMAPLAGLQKHKLAPLWTRAANLFFRYGEEFYNFEGLRRYKEKFRPVWEPRYLAAPGGLGLPRILADITSLIGGGAANLVRRR